MAQKEILEHEEEVLQAEIEEVEQESQSAADLLSKYRNYIFIGVGVVALLLIGGVLLGGMSGKKGAEAQEQMFRSVNYFEADSLDLALNGDNEYPGLLDIISDFGSTDAGNLAKYYAGIAYVKKGEVEEGIGYLKKFKKGDNMASVAAYMALGFAHEEINKPGEAGSFFEKAARAVGTNKLTTPTMLLNAGRNYEAAGKASKALQIYKEIKEKYPQSTEGTSIDKYIGRASNG